MRRLILASRINMPSVDVKPHAYKRRPYCARHGLFRRAQARGAASGARFAVAQVFCCFSGASAANRAAVSAVMALFLVPSCRRIDLFSRTERLALQGNEQGGGLCLAAPLQHANPDRERLVSCTGKGCCCCCFAPRASCACCMLRNLVKPLKGRSKVLEIWGYLVRLTKANLGLWGMQRQSLKIACTKQGCWE